MKAEQEADRHRFGGVRFFCVCLDVGCEQNCTKNHTIQYGKTKFVPLHK